MIEYKLDLYISMNEDLTRELKDVHNKFAQFLKGIETKAGMGEASIAMAKFFVSM